MCVLPGLTASVGWVGSDRLTEGYRAESRRVWALIAQGKADGNRAEGVCAWTKHFVLGLMPVVVPGSQWGGGKGGSMLLQACRRRRQPLAAWPRRGHS